MTSPQRPPQLSVVMPVHNALPHLDEAVRSILGQSWPDFEFVIFDDASTDGSGERLQEWAVRDSRIRLAGSAANLGPVGSSNAVVRLAEAPIIARMDADDVSHPRRLERQIDFLEKHEDVGLVGTMYEAIGGDGRTIRGANYWRLFHSSWFVPFPHGSIMYRRELFDRLGGYREECVFWEDQDFFLRASALTRIVTMPEPLYQHRHSTVSTRLASDQARVERSVDLMYRSVGRLDRNRDYEDLLQMTSAETGKVDPRVFISLGSLALWAGGRPRLFRRLLKRGELSFDTATASALVWTLWASSSPSTLRGFMRFLAALKNVAVGRRKLGNEVVDWRTRKDLPARSTVNLEAASTAARR